MSKDLSPEIMRGQELLWTGWLLLVGYMAVGTLAVIAGAVVIWGGK